MAKKTQVQEPTRVAHYMMDPDDLTLVVDPKHYLYDKRVEAPITEAFVRNIDRYGVIEPVIVCKDGDEYLVVAGRRRVLGARKVNEIRSKDGREPIKIPCLPKRAATDHGMMALMVAENEHREADGALARAAKMQRMLDLGATRDDISCAFGITGQTVDASLALLDCDNSVKQAVEHGRLSATAAWKLSKLARAEQKARLEELLKAVPEGVRVTVMRAKKAANGEQHDKERSTPIRFVRKLRDTMDGSKYQQDYALLRWVTGQLDTSQLAIQRPDLKSYLDHLEA